MPTLSLRSVAAFIAVAETGSFAGAARTLFIDASTASKLVKILENELGASLLRRSTRQVALTERGAAALGASRDLLAQASALQAAVR